MKQMTLAVISLFLCNAAMHAQEDCNTVGDEDNDRLWDCADPDCTCDDAFPCVSPAVMYQMANATDLRTWNGSTWVSEGIANVRTLNAMGYNVQDGYLYAMRTKPGYKNHMCRFTRNGTVNCAQVTNLPVPSGNGSNDIYYVGDCDISGNLYVVKSNTTEMYAIDIGTWSTSSTPITLSAASGVADFAYSFASGGNFYGASQAGYVVEVTPSGTVTQIPYTTSPAPACTSAYGAAFADVSGKIRVYCNESGAFYELTPQPSAAAPTSFDWAPLNTSGLSMTLNDGASCPLARFDQPKDTLDCCEKVLDILQHWPPPAPVEDKDEEKFNRIQEQLNEIKSRLEETAAPEPLAVLHQNKPNPFDERTVIVYEIMKTEARSASISIFNMNGVLIHSYPVAVQPHGELMIQGNTLRPGMYLYTLILGDSEVDTKRMIMLE